jgi:lipid-A-disaccharide synthase
MPDSPLPKFQPVADNCSFDLLVIAGEHSGDEHAATLLRKLLKLDPNLKAAAIGGQNLVNAGAQLLYNPLESGIVGFVEVIKHLDYLKALFRETLDWIDKYRPRVVCFVDYPGFNLRIAKQLFERGLSEKGGGNVRLVYYISPQIWAWKAKRRFQMAKHLNALGVIFPFEVDCYKDTDLPVEFIGHPFVDPDFRLPVTYDPAGPLLVLPGSRSAPIQRIFPIMVETFNRLKKNHPGLKAIVMYPTEKIRQQLTGIIEKSGDSGDFQLVTNDKTFTARAVLTSSGTISLVCALAGIPGVVVYRANPISYLIAKWLVKIRVVGIANIILGKFIHPEFLQSAMNPDILHRELTNQLDDPETFQSTQALSRELREKLDSDDSQRSAKWLLDQLRLNP